MNCPVCDSRKIRTLDSRWKDKNTRWRSKECQECLTRFHTSERVVYSSLDPYVLEKIRDKEGLEWEIQ